MGNSPSRTRSSTTTERRRAGTLTSVKKIFKSKGGSSKANLQNPDKEITITERPPSDNKGKRKEDGPTFLERVKRLSNRQSKEEVQHPERPSSLRQSKTETNLNDKEKKIEQITAFTPPPYEADCESFDEVSESEQEQEDVENDFVGCAEFVQETDEVEADVRCLNGQEGIRLEQDRAIHETAEILSVPAPFARRLLQHYRWNKDKLLVAFVDDPVKVCKAAGLPAPQPVVHHHSAAHSAQPLLNIPKDHSHGKDRVSLSSPGASSASSNPSTFSCTICGEDGIEWNFTTALATCHHRFCNACWEQYVTMKISEGETRVTCAYRACNEPIDDQVVRRLVPADVHAKYLRFITKSFVEENPAVRWCPRPGCGNAINALDPVQGAITCSCGYRFCFRCNDEAHAPATCDQVKNWREKCKDDSETTHWININTQTCPRCRSSIEKNGGCNHMICRQCKYEFCWVCHRDWKGHNDFYSCNKIKKEEEKKKKPNNKKENQKEKEAREREAARMALEKYLTYFQKYSNYNKTKEYNELKEQAKTKMLQLQEIDSTWVGVQFIQKAVDQLILSYSTLKNSYIYAYYFEEGVGKSLFEYLQKDLEDSTKSLADSLSVPLNQIQRVHIVNQTRLVQQRLIAVLEHAQDQQPPGASGSAINSLSSLNILAAGPQSTSSS